MSCSIHFAMRRTLLLLTALAFFSIPSHAQHKSISRPVLEDLLSHAVTILSLNDYCKTPEGFYPGTATRIVEEAELRANDSPGSITDLLKKDRESGAVFARYNDVLRLIRNVRPKFITDAVTHWGAWDWHTHMERCRATVRDIKALDSAIVVQASLNEFADLATSNAIGEIPAWVWEAFGQKDEHRTFDIYRMMFADWQRQGENGTPLRWWNYAGQRDGLPVALVPDIRTTEAQMWFYYQSRLFIDMGCESLTFSQVELMNNNSLDPMYWAALFEKLRAYADNRADIRYLLITGHTNGMVDAAGNLAFDFHSGPVRPSEIGPPENAAGGDCDITANSCHYASGAGKLYNRSIGGRTPSGWVCESLPGLVFMDNYGNEGPDTTWGSAKGAGTCAQYHFDEITWFALQDLAYRDAWLRYAAARVRRLDKNLYFAPPVKRVVTYRKDWYPADYLANNPVPGALDTPATMGGMPGADIDRATVGMHCGYGQEETIKEIMAGAYTYAEPRGLELSLNPGKDWVELSLGDDVFDGPVRYNLRSERGGARLRGRFAERSQKIAIAKLPPGQYRVSVKSGRKRTNSTLYIGR